MTAVLNRPATWTPAEVYRRSLRTLPREHGFGPMEVVGAVPESLRGTLYRAGPAVFESFGTPYGHPFEADGGVTAIRFGDDGVEGAAKLIQSAGLQAERAAGRSLYSSPAPWWRRFLAGLRQDVKNTGNTAMLQWQGRLFALMEAAPPTELNPADLSTLGEDRLDGLVQQAFTAHPHRVEARKTTYAFGLNYGPSTKIDMYALPDAGPARKVTSIPLPWATLVHDFAVTEKHAVFLVAPAALVMWRALLAVGGMTDMIRWEPERGACLFVVPLDDPDAVRRIDVEPFWVWHFGGAFEDRGDIVVDMSRYEDLGSLEEIEGADEGEQARMYRMRIPPAGRPRLEQLWEGAAEFPIVHPRVSRHAHTWVVTTGGIARIDDGTAELHPVPAHRMATEPIFVPTGPREKDGWILSLIYDAEVDRSFLSVLDAAHLARPAVAELWFDQRIPVTFHGTFVPA